MKLLWILPGVKNIHLQNFRPMQLVVLAAEGKTGFDFGEFIIEIHKASVNSELYYPQWPSYGGGGRNQRR